MEPDRADRSGRCTLSVEARAYGHGPRTLAAEVEQYTGAQRVGRALRVAAPWLVGALVSLPIPGWHFVGVPGCLGAAAVLGGRKLRERAELVSLEGGCPACGVERQLAARVPLAAELTLRCPDCGEFVRVTGLLGAPAT